MSGPDPLPEQLPTWDSWRGWGRVARALVLSGDGGPDALCPTCQSITTWKPAHQARAGETTSLPAEVGSQCSSIIQHLGCGGRARPAQKTSLHGIKAPWGWVGRAVRGDGKRYRKVLKQEGAEMY